MPGPLALVGSGEYLPVLEDVERLLLHGRPPRFVQLATAAAPEGQASLAHWHALGRASAERLGVQQVVVPVVDRISADDRSSPGWSRERAWSTSPAATRRSSPRRCAARRCGGRSSRPGTAGRPSPAAAPGRWR
jgi:hypothetical protein